MAEFDAIIVLGAGITKRGNLTAVARSRMDKALELYREGLAPRIITTGRGEAAVMKKYAVGKGVSAGKILAEGASRDTIGNALFVRKKFLEPEKWRRLAVVTSLFHLPRSRLVFRKVLGSGYRVKFVAARRVLPIRKFREKLRLERGLTIATMVISSLFRDGDAEAFENFIGTKWYRKLVKNSR